MTPEDFFQKKYTEERGKNPEYPEIHTCWAVFCIKLLEEYCQKKNLD